ncbi:MAG: GntP family permease [Xanthobacteraceae bacterium]
MSAMPLFQALALFSAVLLLVIATQSRNVHPFLALVVIASAFGMAAGFSVGFLGKAFGIGFAEMIYSPGLVIVAAALVTGLAESSTASDRLKMLIDRWRWFRSTRLAALLGLIAGLGASPATAFALLTPLFPALAGTAQKRGSVAVTTALAISASHGLLLLSPVPIAAAAILGAEWGRVALFGLPVAVLLSAFAALFPRWLSIDNAASRPRFDEPQPAAEKRDGGSAVALLLAIAIPLSMLLMQSVGDIPSEPLGGGTSRELVLGTGRPLVLFLVGLGIMSVGQWRQSVKLLTDTAWTARMIGNVSALLLTICAAGGLQRLCQETGMAELLGERLLGWHGGTYVGAPLGLLGGLLIPFLVAATIKTLQGSSLVAAITAAGMVQPILTPLGLDGANAKALAALAIGAGAMTLCHVNDEYFWLVADRAGLSPLRALTVVSVGTLLQGVIAVTALLALSLLA